MPDFPWPGVLFKDILPLLGDGRGFAAAVAALVAPWRDADVAAVAGVEARGFILGAGERVLLVDDLLATLVY